jgi:hypothetical protein
VLLAWIVCVLQFYCWICLCCTAGSITLVFMCSATTVWLVAAYWICLSLLLRLANACLGGLLLLVMFLYVLIRI